MGYDRKRCERMARAIASDTMVYSKSAIDKGLEDDSLFESLSADLEKNRKEFLARVGEEAYATNILECATADVMIFPMGEEKKYPIF